LYDRITALKDIVPPKTRSKITSVSNSIYSAASNTITYSGKGIWVLATSILLLGIPYALALGEEQQFVEQERQQALMQEGAQGMIQGQQGDAKPAL
jgi:import receptor subunit TOM22